MTQNDQNPLLSLLDLQNKWAFVGGASQGIGAAIARRLAEAGARVVLVSRSRDRLEQVRQSLPNPNRHLVHSFDLEKTDSIPASLQQLLTTTGPIEIVVNNTGGPAAGPLQAADPNDFERGFRAHVIASQLIFKALLAGMKERHYGRIINIISTSVKVPITNLGISNTIRAAMANWSKTLANEVAIYGITVNNVLPGYTRTARMESLAKSASSRDGLEIAQVEAAWLKVIPAGRFAEPADIANAVLFLASPMAGYVNGTNLVVDGGRTGTL